MSRKPRNVTPEYPAGKPGRPTRDPAGPADTQIALKVRSERKQAYQKAAKAKGRTLQGFILDAADKETVKTLGK